MRLLQNPLIFMLFPFNRGSNMGFSVPWSWLAALSCLLCMGCEVRCDCTEENVQIEGGHYIFTTQLQTYSMLIYNCPEDYYPFPDMVRVCQPNGTWKPAPRKFARQRCRMVECPDPNVLESGEVSPPQERYFVNNETTYECYSGYTMRGSPKRTCLSNGKWSGSTPICSRDSTGDDCADPGIPAGASRIGNMFGVGNSVKYSCNGNLFLVGSSERVCQENGQWTGKEPTCYYKHTYDTALEVSEEFGRAFIEKLTILDQNQINNTGQGKKIQISKSRSLNIYIAVDISASIQEEQIESAKEAVAKLISKVSSFAVTPNYEIVFFSCEIFEAVNILGVFKGPKPISDVMSDLKNFQIRKKGTAATDLNLVFKTFYDRMAMMKLRIGQEAFKEHRHVIIVFTDGGYNMGGSPKPYVDKIKDLVYMGQTGEGETQSREEYLDIYVFGIGLEIYDEDLQPLTVGSGGSHYFRMKDIYNLQETFDEMIDEEEVLGLCGLHQEYDTFSRDSKRKKYPWLAFINIQNEERSQKCLGSLVSPQFILTAAHCLPFGVIPEHITVEIDDGVGRAKKVKNFRIHPNYNVRAKVQEGVTEFYDYDVALIQLETDVHISTLVRPICIPCTKETSGALKLVGVSTCKEQEQLLLKNQLERLSFLTNTRRSIEEKGVMAKLGAARDECIRHALQAPGITVTDPESVVTDNFLCTGGRNPYRDHIACPGDGGGAVFKNYEHRTIQVAVVSWGTKLLCNEGGLVESDETSRDFHINLFRVVPFLQSILGDDNQDEYVPLQFLAG